MTANTEPSIEDIDRYEVLHCSNLPLLKSQVQSMLEKGWLLQGGVSAGTDQSFLQALASSTERLKRFASMRG